MTDNAFHTDLSSPDAEVFDVVVIGGGINGAAALRELTAAGYSALLVEKGDVASGASGRSSRMLHCGLRYFETPNPVKDFGLHPFRFMKALGMARDAMKARAELSADASVATRKITLCFPLWSDGPMPRWQVSLGLGILKNLDRHGPPLEAIVHGRAAAADHPVTKTLRDRDRLSGLATFSEYLFSHPERIALDAVLNAEASGAKISLNCTAHIAGRADDGLWQVDLEGPTNQKRVSAKVVLNMAGTWADNVSDFPKRLIRGTKGSHIVIRLPEHLKGFGIATINRQGFPFYGLPLGDELFYFGPTETPFDGDATDVRCTSEEIDILLDEANYLLPGLGLKRADVLQGWAGVRPLTWDPERPMGARERVLHDLEADGFPNVLALTAGPVMGHRSAGRLIASAVEKKIGKPVRKPVPPCKQTEIPEDPYIRAVTHEHARNLYGVLVQRTGAVWNGLVERQEAEDVARRISPLLGWDEVRTAKEVDSFLQQQSHHFAVPKKEEGRSSPTI